MPFSQLGLCPEFGASLLLPLRVGQATASHWLMSGLVVAAPEAQAKGFIHALAEDPWAAAWQQARAWDAMSQQALCSTKALLKAPWQQPLAQAMDLELAAFAKALKGPAFAEAQAAFFAKRPANFSAL